MFAHVSFRFVLLTSVSAIAATAAVLGGCADYDNMARDAARRDVPASSAPKRSAAALVRPRPVVRRYRAAARNADEQSSGRRAATPAAVAETSSASTTSPAMQPTATAAGRGLKGESRKVPSDPAPQRDATVVIPKAAPPAAADAASALKRRQPPQIQQGLDLFRRGEVLKARAVLLSAVSVAPADVLLELARTFDPYFINELSASDGKPEPQRALSLYEEAIRNGSMQARRDLERLRQDHPDLR